MEDISLKGSEKFVRSRRVAFDDHPARPWAEQANKELEKIRHTGLYHIKLRREVALYWLWGDFRYPARLSPRYRWTVFRRKVLYCWGVLRDLWRLL